MLVLSLFMVAKLHKMYVVGELYYVKIIGSIGLPTVSHIIKTIAVALL